MVISTIQGYSAWEFLRPEGTRPRPKRVSERSARGLAPIISARSPESLSPTRLYSSLGRGGRRRGGEEGERGNSWSVTNKGLLTGLILWKTREAGKESSTNYKCQTSTKPLLDSSLIVPFLGGGASWSATNKGLLSGYISWKTTEQPPTSATVLCHFLCPICKAVVNQYKTVQWWWIISSFLRKVRSWLKIFARINSLTNVVIRWDWLQFIITNFVGRVFILRMKVNCFHLSSLLKPVLIF